MAASRQRQIGDPSREAMALGRDDAGREAAARALTIIERFADDLAERL